MLHEDLLIVRRNVIWMYTERISISCHLPVWCFGRNGVSLSLSFHRSWPIWNHLWCYVKIILILYCGGSLCKVCCVRYDLLISDFLCVSVQPGMQDHTSSFPLTTSLCVSKHFSVTCLQEYEGNNPSHPYSHFHFQQTGTERGRETNQDTERACGRPGCGSGSL